MRTLSLIAGLSASILTSVTSLPVDTPLSTDHAHIKRWEAGPQIGGLNFPDPSIIQVDDVWYSFATRSIGSGIHIQIAYSYDFTTWGMINYEDGSQRDALPDLPPWVDARFPNTWAPDVQQLDDGTFVMYYCATTAADFERHCVGAAFSQNILGPYIPQEDALICPMSQGGAIDASGFDDNGQRYIVYKIDGNAIGHGGACGNTVKPITQTPIVLQAVGRDGVSFESSMTTILENNGLADQGVIEAPSLVRAGSTYVLFFSSGCYTTPNYTVNYAISDSIKGPYTRASRPLFITGDNGLVAPGGMAIHSDAQHMLFHANSGNGRALHAATVAINGSKVTLHENLL